MDNLDPATHSRLHALVDRLPTELLAAASRALEAVLMAGEAARPLQEDEEKLSGKGLRFLQEGLEDIRRGDVISDDDVWAELEARGRLNS